MVFSRKSGKFGELSEKREKKGRAGRREVSRRLRERRRGGLQEGGSWEKELKVAGRDDYANFFIIIVTSDKAYKEIGTSWGRTSGSAARGLAREEGAGGVRLERASGEAEGGGGNLGN